MRKFLVLFCWMLGQFLCAQSNDLMTFIELNSLYSSDFLLDKKLVFVKASIGKRQGHFMLDSAASALFLSDKHFQTKHSNYEAQSIIGAIEIKNDFKTRIKMGNLLSKRTQAFVLDFSLVLNKTKKDLIGLIGYDFLKNYEFFLDYKNQKFSLFDPTNIFLKDLHKSCSKIPFEIHGHLIVIDVEIEGNVFKMAVDTGSSINVLDKQFQNQLISSKQNMEFIKMKSINDGIKVVETKLIRVTKIEDVVHENMPFVFTSLTNFNETLGVHIDGLLGFPFFQNQILSINYQTKEIYIWDDTNIPIKSLSYSTN